jgi:hypothetical protein
MGRRRVAQADAESEIRLGVGFGLAQAGDPVARFPLAAFLENLDPFKSFQNIAFGSRRAGRAQTSML